MQFSLNDEPLLQHEIEDHLFNVQIEKEKKKKRAILFIILGLSLYIAAGASAYLYRSQTTDLVTTLYLISAAFVWLLYTNIIAPLESRKIHTLSLSTLALALLLFFIPSELIPLPHHHAVASAAAFVIVIRYLFDNRPEEINALNNMLNDLSEISMEDTRIHTKIERIRAISTSVDDYLKKLEAIDRPLILAEYLLILDQYHSETASAPGAVQIEP